MNRFATILALLILLAMPVQAQPTLFAAASLRGVLEEVFAGHPNLRIAYGGSGAMARQVAAGAPADAIVLAHPDWMDWLSENSHVDPATRMVVASNSLVLIGRAGSGQWMPQGPEDILGRLDGGRLAMGQRDAVPAGRYAKEWLVRIEAWALLEPHLAETDDVRAALALVATGATPLGLVYATDARADDRVMVHWQIPTPPETPIHYVAAAVTPDAAAILAELDSPGARAIFGKHGFGAP